MKFLIAKNDDIRCFGCDATIMRGQDMVLTFGLYGKFKKAFTYHTTCYITWYTRMFNQKWYIWKHGVGNTVRVRRGTPVKITEPTTDDLLNRLRSNLSYHKKLGHTAQVASIETKICKLLGK